MDKDFKRGVKIVVGGLVLMAVVLLVLSWWVKDAKALDQSPPIEAALVESIDVEDVYLKLKVDWEHKADITRVADSGCNDVVSDKKVDCYKANNYFDKQQISQKALMDFVDFMQEHNVK